MKVVGLTGGIGSGKTTVAGFFKELEVPVYIADTEAKRLMNADPLVKKQVQELFGEDSYVEGQLDRKKLAEMVFNNKDRLEALNAVVHPAVERDFAKWKDSQKAPYVLYEAAILFEKGGYKKCDYTILVTAGHQQKIERLLKRDRSTPAEIQSRMSHQWSDEKKAELADFLIENSSLSETRKRVQELHQILLESA